MSRAQPIRINLPAEATADEIYSELQKGPRAAGRIRSNRPVYLGEHYDSDAELNWYTRVLQMEEAAGVVRHVKHHPLYRLVVNDQLICSYEADKSYERAVMAADGTISWQPETVDVKGMKTDVYKIKRKLMQACLGITIIEIDANDFRNEGSRARRKGYAL